MDVVILVRNIFECIILFVSILPYFQEGRRHWTGNYTGTNLQKKYLSARIIDSFPWILKQKS